MMRPRWKKVIREIWTNKRRSLLVIASISLGVMASCLTVCAQVILQRELPLGYAFSFPAHAMFNTTEFDEDFLESIRRVPGVAEAQGRRSSWTRVQTASKDTNPMAEPWKNLILFGISDFMDQRINRVEPVQGEWPPGDQEVLLEQAALGLSGARLGDMLNVRTADGHTFKLRLSGLVHDQSQQPATFEGNLYGYVNLDTLEWMGESRGLDELSILLDVPSPSRSEVRTVAERVRDQIEDSGRVVYFLSVPEPGKHPLQDTVDGVLLLLGAFGVLILALSGFLVLNTISALLGQQVRQVGIMKAIGASSGQLLRLYLGMALFFGMAGSLWGIPAGLWGGRQIALFVAGVINADLENLGVPIEVLMAVGSVGVITAIVAALGPVMVGVRLPVRLALSSNISDTVQFSPRLFGRYLLFQGMPLTLALPLRNSLRARGRLILTLMTMTMGSAFFVSVTSIYSSIRVSVDEIFRYWQYDLMVTFEETYRVNELVQAALKVHGVSRVDPGFLTRTNRVYVDNRQGDMLFLYALPADTFSLNPKVIDGRWLLPGDRNAVVVSNRFLEEEPDVRIGDIIRLKLSGKEATWQVVGVIHMMYADGPTVYVNLPYYAQVTGNTGEASQLYVLTDQHSTAYQLQVMRALDDAFRRRGDHISLTIPMSTLRASIREVFNAIVVILMIMAILLSIVGGVGLMGIMELNVMERSRELGVMRSIGGTGGRLLMIVLIEGLFIGGLSWLLGCLLAIPISKYLDDAVGMVMIQGPLKYNYSCWGAGLWLTLVLILSTMSCAIPALRAYHLTIREALAYE